MTGRNKKKVAVAMSGGVDSSVTAFILQNEGYEVTGLTMQLWKDPGSSIDGGADSEFVLHDAAGDARRVAEFIGMEHHLIDLREQFYHSIVCPFSAEYMKGRTPSPCIECNRLIKFGALLEAARSLGLNMIATGHYVQKIYDSKKKLYRLYRGHDREKDQSYMLYRLTQEVLSASIFPLGGKTKEEVRKLAAAAKLPVSGKDDSQEICFLPGNDYRSFLKRNHPEALKQGEIVSPEGVTLGEHPGIAFYTIGQRKGLGLTAPHPLYVIDIDPLTNKITVGREEDLYSTETLIEKVNFISTTLPVEALPVTVKIRYRAPLVPALFYPLPNGSGRVIFEERQKAVTPGQSAVFYDGDEVIGGGVIAEAIS